MEQLSYNNKPFRIALFGCWHDDNKGDSAIISSTIKLIRTYYPDCEISLYSLFKKSSRKFNSSLRFSVKGMENINIKSHEYCLDVNKANKRDVPFDKLVEIFNKTNSEVIPNLFEEAIDLIISPGGQRFFTRNGNDFTDLVELFLFHCYPLLMAKRLNIPYVVLSQSIGPINGIYAKHLIKYVLSHASYISLREQASKEEVIKLGVSEDLIHLVPDTAFLLERKVTERLTDLIATKGLIKNKCVIITPKIWFAHNDKRYLAYLQVLGESCKYLHNLGYQIVLLAHTIGPIPIEDDRIACRDLYQLLKKLGINNVIILEEDFSPQELAELYSYGKLVIATRFHSMVFALTSGVPVYGISYFGHKITGVMESIGLGEYSTDINNLTLDNVIKGINNIIVNYEHLKNHINSAVDRNRLLIYEKSKEMLDGTIN